MKSKILYFLPVLLGFSTIATAASNDARFRKEVRDGLDIATWDVELTPTEYKGGALGMEVYSMSNLSQEQCCANSDLYCCNQPMDKTGARGDDYALYIPSNMYIRAGGGFNLNFGTSRATYGPANLKAKSSGTWGMQVGLGWNISPFVRIEGDVQVRHFKFTDAPWSAYDLKAKTQSAGAMAYFDFMPRYKRTGDITRPSRVVPFFGIGLSGGAVDFADAGVDPIGFGHGDRSAYVAPRATLGVSFAVNEMMNLDIAYQYEMMLLGKFGWETDSGMKSISDVMVSLRFNF